MLGADTRMTLVYDIDALHWYMTMVHDTVYAGEAVDDAAQFAQRRRAFLKPRKAWSSLISSKRIVTQ